MPDALEWFLTGGDWYDWRQEKRIEGSTTQRVAAESSLRRANAASEARLVERISRLEDAFAAFVELEDVREGLTAHADDAMVRRHVRSQLLGLQQFGGVADNDLPPLPDSPSYWLAATAEWAERFVAGGSADETLLDTARGRDPVRTDLFALALAGLTGQDGDAIRAFTRLTAGPWLVTAWQRTIWAAAAERRFGDESRAALVDSLRASSDIAGLEVLGALLPGESPATASLDACRQLRDLASRLASEREEAERTAAPEVADDPLAELVAVLVGEGAPGEVAVLDKMSSIRNVLASSSSIETPVRVSLDRQVGDVAALLRSDLADIESSKAPLRSVATEVVSGLVASLADELHGRIDVIPPARQEAVVCGKRFEVPANGLERSVWISAIDERHTKVSAADGPWLTGVVAAGVIALIGALMTLAGAPLGFFIIVLGGAGVAISGAKVRRGRAARDAGQRLRANEIDKAEHQISSAQKTAAERDSEAASLIAAADEHYASILRAAGRD